MNLRQILTAPNQLTLLRMIFLPFIVINVVGQHYVWALVLFVLAGISDGLDGLLARKLHQQTQLGQYLDPIADKLLMSTMFLVLSIEHRAVVPWKFTVVVFSRDISILLVSGVLFMIAGLKDFRPSIFGKSEYRCPGRGDILRNAITRNAGGLGRYCAQDVSQGHVLFYDSFRGALRVSRATPAANARAVAAGDQRSKC